MSSPKSPAGVSVAPDEAHGAPVGPRERAERVVRAANSARVSQVAPATTATAGDQSAAPRERAARRQRAQRSEDVDGTAFLYAIIDAGERLRDARAFHGLPALPLDARSNLLRAIERCGGAPSFADLARLLQVSPTAARNRALAAVAAGVVELLPCPDDRRLIQVALTPAGRRALEARRMPPLDWVHTLLNGLQPATMAACEHVLRVLAARLDRYEREMRRARRGAPGAY